MVNSPEVNNTPTCTYLRGTNMGKACILQRVSQWLWSSWTVSAPGSHPALPDSTPQDGRNQNYRWESRIGQGVGGSSVAVENATPRYLPPIVEEQQHDERPSEDTTTSSSISSISAYPCKGCQTWGASCDRQRPRCSHCLDQQILCFYVAPMRKSTRRSKDSRPPRSSSHKQAQTHIEWIVSIDNSRVRAGFPVEQHIGGPLAWVSSVYPMPYIRFLRNGKDAYYKHHTRRVAQSGALRRVMPDNNKTDHESYEDTRPHT
ncbi:hypothetical protein FE257_003651 [Aspergillus nanangensis]|uniref:Zn(2)-C6 fungal-type domain-containing protein n=1 Tax=Aspergillus nanangensis TaxID=2582783 RepID=A0AAD4GWF9_ASPNN|nr:hypothetical protein FE257_003651 [Aspergillus nanangensis]